MVSASLLTQESMWLRPHHPGATLCKHWSPLSPWRKKRVENPTHAFAQSRINTHHFSSHCVEFHSTSKGLKVCREEVKHLVIIASAPWSVPCVTEKTL